MVRAARTVLRLRSPGSAHRTLVSWHTGNRRTRRHRLCRLGGEPLHHLGFPNDTVTVSRQYGDPAIWPGDTFGISPCSPGRLAGENAQKIKKWAYLLISVSVSRPML